MARIEIELPDDVLAWAEEAAQADALTVGGYVERLQRLESDLRRQVSDGRALRAHAFMYRDGGHYFVEDRPFVPSGELT